MGSGRKVIPYHAAERAGQSGPDPADEYVAALCRCIPIHCSQDSRLRAGVVRFLVCKVVCAYEQSFIHGYRQTYVQEGSLLGLVGTWHRGR